MITFRDRTEVVDSAGWVRRLDRLALTGDAEAFLVEAGVFEQGVADRLNASQDGWTMIDRRLRDLVRIAGAAYVTGQSGGRGGPLLAQARRVLGDLAGGALPGTLVVYAPEGYVHYALDPASYAGSARRYVNDVGCAAASTAVVIGVRSIGTSLSGVVAAVLGTTRSVTVRPRGGSGSRYVAADGALEQRLATWLAEGGDVLVVDEGPGATGETLHCVARWLESLGIERRRHVLVPSHTGGMSLAPEERRAWFTAARTYAPTTDEARIERVFGQLDLSDPEDLSGGRWRDVLPGTANEAACTSHERRKYRAKDRTGRPHVLRYSGLGRWGREVNHRATRLADAGIGPSVLGSSRGFIALEWVSGRPLTRAARYEPAFVVALAEYLCARSGRFRTGTTVDVGPVMQAFVENTREALGPDVPGFREAVARLEHLRAREAVIPDAHLQPREWIRTAEGFAKVDALDHGDGIQLPGPADAAWDLAAAAVEYGLSGGVTNDLVRRCAGPAGDSAAELASAVEAYRAPYAACSLGEAQLAAWQACSTEDARRWEREAALYLDLLKQALACAT